MKVTIDEREYILTPDNAILVFPNQIHSLQTPTHSRHFLCIFSSDLVQAYSSVFTSKLPVNNSFLLNSATKQQLTVLQTNSNALFIKGILYLLCADFDSNAQYADRQGDPRRLLLKIFEFVEKNYVADCSLEALAASLAYSPVYLSRFFKKNTKMTFTEYVIRYRVNEASYLLRNSPCKLLDIAYSCGFNSLRSFNRCFKEKLGTTPSAYRTCQSFNKVPL